MAKINRSVPFDRLHSAMLENYRDNATPAYANRYAEGVEASIAFIARHPGACAPHGVEGNKELRKWPVKNFPAVIFFSIDANGLITLEAIYGMQQDIASRLPRDVQ